MGTGRRGKWDNCFGASEKLVQLPAGRPLLILKPVACVGTVGLVVGQWRRDLKEAELTGPLNERCEFYVVVTAVLDLQKNRAPETGVDPRGRLVDT
jgi:hypothetical protein